MNELEKKTLYEIASVLLKLLDIDSRTPCEDPKGDPSPNVPSQNENGGILIFSNKEIQKMPKYFRAERLTVFYRKRGGSYEARFRRLGYNISVSARDLEELKRRFISAINCADGEREDPKALPEPTYAPNVPTDFNAFAMFYFENFRRRKVKPNTYEKDLCRIRKHLLPFFQGRTVRSITPIDCQRLLDGKPGKTCDELFSLTNQILKCAIAHGLIERNPLSVVFHRKHEHIHGTSLSKEEEKILISRARETEYFSPIVIALYCGLRPNELETARRDGAFIVARNSKRKNGREETKKIPISPMLRKYIEEIDVGYVPPMQNLRRFFNRIFPERKFYDLRTTFYTRCQELGVVEIARKLFVGHSLGVLADTYTSVSDDFLLIEGEKLDY